MNLNRRRCLWLLLATAGLPTGCRSLRVDARVSRPVDLTATAEADAVFPIATPTHRSTPPTAAPTPTAAGPIESTPTPRLGTLAFIRGGDVWVKDLPDGTARRLTTDGINDWPRWSPNGQWLQFRKGRAADWVMRADGSNARDVADSTSGVEWSPKSDALTYTNGAGLFVADLAGGPPRQLVTPSAGSRTGNAVWSVDGRSLAFDELRLGQAPPAGHPIPLVADATWRINADGTGRTRLYQNPVPSKPLRILAGWSPDGRYLLSWRDTYYHAADSQADGYPLVALPATGSAPINLPGRTLVDADFLSWAPTGHQLAFVDAGYRSTWYPKPIAVIDLPGPARVLSAPDRADLFPAWSPDGQWIAYTSAPAVKTDGGTDAKRAAEKRRIWRMRSDGTDKRQLTNDATYRDERPEWSADGKAILFSRFKGDTAQVWLMQADGSNPHLVVDELTPAPSWFGYYGYIQWGLALRLVEEAAGAGSRGLSGDATEILLRHEPRRGRRRWLPVTPGLGRPAPTDRTHRDGRGRGSAAESHARAAPGQVGLTRFAGHLILWGKKPWI